MEVVGTLLAWRLQAVNAIIPAPDFKRRMEVAAVSFPKLLPQCCDAENYLQLGSECAKGLNGCYDSLRPMGSVVWFSIPYRLGLPPDYIIIGNLLLAVVSIVLSSLVMEHLVQSLNPREPEVKQTRSFLLSGFSTAAHIVFLYPVLFNSIPDTPAAMLALIGVWLLLLSRLKPSLATLGGAGGMFGLAAFFRVFYLIPVLIVFVAFAIVWSRRRRRAELIFLIGLLPILLQCMATLATYGHFNYLQNKQMAYSSTHLKSNMIGYDTLLPAEGHPWELEGVEKGPFSLLWNGEFKDALRLFAGRIEFYFGSYSQRVYMTASRDRPSAVDTRIWSRALLVMNLCTIACAIWIFPKLTRALGPEMHMVSTAAVTIIGQALLIVPEQRFIIAFQILMWIAAAIAIFSYFRPGHTAANTR